MPINSLSSSPSSESYPELHPESHFEWHPELHSESLAFSPAPPLITEEQAVEYVASLTPANLRKVNCMIGDELAHMVLPWDVTGALWAYARRKVITELINRFLAFMARQRRIVIKEIPPDVVMPN